MMARKPIPNADWRHRGTALFTERFLMRPAARPDESFLGYRLRVAHANGLSNPGWLVCVEDSLPKSHGVARWCPHCLSALDGYWREDWYTGRAACLVHQCWLTSKCGACRRTLRWSQARFVTCTCGAALQDVRVDAFSADVLMLVDGQIEANAGRLSLDERWNLARFLGALSQFGLQGKPLKKASRQKENSEKLTVTAGASLIADQAACFEMLDRLRTPQSGMNDVPLLSMVFPRLITMIRTQLSVAERCLILDLLDAYVARTSARGGAMVWERKGKTWRLNTGLRRPQETPNAAIFRMLARTGATIPVRRTRAGRQKFVISQADLHALQATQHSLVPLKAAARYAGISTRRIQALAEARLVASNGARIDTRSVDRVLEGVAAASVRDVQVLEDPVSLTDALRLYVPVEASAAFFNRLMSGAVRLVFGPNEVPALRDIYANRGDMISAARPPTETSSRISIVEAARRLGVKQEVMYHLINTGLIRTKTGKLGRRRARVVDIDDLQKFTEQFMPLFSVAKGLGLSAREAPAWARQHGIEIVTGPSVDGGRQYWIRRQAGLKFSCSVEREA
jgi:hypothetical protein